MPFSAIVLEALYDEETAPDLPRFMGPVFEVMGHRYLTMLSSQRKTPFRIGRLGRWWGSGPVNKAEEEIDLIGINDKISSVAFCECKFRKQLIDNGILNNLKRKSNLVSGF